MLAALQRARNRLWKRKSSSSRAQDVVTLDDAMELPEECWPTFPPPAPEDILAARQIYRMTHIRPRRFAAPKGEYSDTPLYAIYRLYEWFLLDHTTGYRNDLEIFWRHHEWRIKDIPDPADDCPARYAFLAGVVHLLVTSFNQKVSHGSKRNAPAIMTTEYIDALRSVPLAERQWEEMPQWARDVLPLPTVLSVPTNEDECLTGPDDPRAEQFFKSKNILIWTPHIHFT